MDSYTKVNAIRFTEDVSQEISETVVREFSLTIVLNDRELVTLLCTPEKLEYLATGFLFSQGLINTGDEIRGIDVDGDKGVIRVRTTGEAESSPPASRRLIASSGAREIIPVGDMKTVKAETSSGVSISPRQVYSLISEFLKKSALFKATGGVHQAALCKPEEFIFFSEDIGRHNAIDKVIGEGLLKGLPLSEHILVTSGRVSSEILRKVVRARIPIVISKSAVTGTAIGLAKESGTTLIGFVRGRKMAVYEGCQRVII